MCYGALDPSHPTLLLAILLESFGYGVAHKIPTHNLKFIRLLHDHP